VQFERSLVRRFHAQAHADRWSVAAETFAAALAASAAHAFGERAPSAAEVTKYLSGLHLDDLALAVGCADGNDAAWEHFVREFRPALYRAADAIDASGGARELADSLYGDLFGARDADSQRRSLFRYFHGRSSLATWLRAVLAQRHVDRLRRARRLEPLPDDDSPAAVVSARAQTDPARPRFVAAMRLALTAAVDQLAPRDRLRLGCYYAQNLTLAAIGRLLGEHEATVSRHLARTRRDLRGWIEAQLRDHDGFSEADIAACFESVASDSGTLDLAEWFASPPGARSDAARVLTSEEPGVD
jgi:RNA polymerase sigma-70 factor (ECF subfamily)